MPSVTINLFEAVSLVEVFLAENLEYIKIYEYIGVSDIYNYSVTTNTTSVQDRFMGFFHEVVPAGDCLISPLGGMVDEATLWGDVDDPEIFESGGQADDLIGISTGGGL